MRFPSRQGKPGLRVAVIGATGMVGGELLRLLESRRFPVGELLCFSSGARDRFVRFRGRRQPSLGVAAAALSSCDLVFLASSDEVSERLAPDLAAAGVWVIDDSAAFRLDPKVPLVIPEVNAAAITASTRLISGPNCTMTGLAVAGAPLHRAAGAREVRIASYQAVSGAGKAALEEFFRQARAAGPRLTMRGGDAPVLPAQAHSALPRAIAGNVIPQVGRFDGEGRTGEENKVAAELKKIWGAPALKVSVTAVRVPVVRGHSLAVWMTLEKPLSPAKAKRLIARSEGVVLSEDGDYPTPLSAGGKFPVYAGRIRRGAAEGELCLWIVSDNLLKGAALNSMQIAEVLLRRGYLGR